MRKMIFDDELGALVEITCSAASVAQASSALVALSGIIMVGNPPADPEREYARAIEHGVGEMLRIGYTAWEISEAFKGRGKHAQRYVSASLELRERE
ncbi:hypothetical protein HY497_00885 [Candidatus Woesearchaeota archaeon]|nr:hypothetical protein [Candidatus Woesearchaeota archaeon]